MFTRWIVLIYILKIHLKTITSQHHHRHYYEPAPQQYDEDEDPDEYDDGPEYNTRHNAKNHKIRLRLQESEECICSCYECITKPKDCCAELCKYCHADATNQNQYPVPSQYQSQIQDQFLNQNQNQKVVLVPYTYPLFFPDAAKNNNAVNSKEHPTQPADDEIFMVKPLSATKTTASITTEPPTTTSEATTTTTKAPRTKKSRTTTKAPSTFNSELRSKTMEVSMLSRRREIKQLNPAVKRTRPAWVPKYGIVPIPDHIAAKLMTQLTEVRALKARKL